MDKLKNIEPKRVGPDTIDRISRIFYICSWTGCGTMILKKALSKQGYITRIVHDRNPPKELEFVTSDFCDTPERANFLKFNGIKVPEKYLDKITVIYIYKNPINSIYSRLSKKNMSRFVSSDREPIEFNDVLEQEKDLYGLEEFFLNYTNKEQERNYKIICVNYHQLFEKQDELSELLGVGPLGLEKKEREHEQVGYDILARIYKSLNFRFLSLNPFITVV